MPKPSTFGAEFRANTTTSGDQDTPSVTALANGKFVVVWEDASQTGGGNSSHSAVRGQLYNADGSPASGEFLVNQTTFGDQEDAVVAGLSDGRFVVAWKDVSLTGGDNSGASVRARIFNVDGSPAGDEFLVNTRTESDQSDPAIAALAGGGFVVTWTDRFSSTDLDIRGRAFDATGAALGSDFPIDTSGNNDETQSAVVGLANGNYAVVWQDEGTLTDNDFGTHIRGTIMSGNGSTVVDQFIVNSENASNLRDQTQPAIDLLSDGNLIVTWSSEFARPSGGFEFDIRGRVLGPNGAPLAGENPLGGGLNDDFGSAVSALANGSYAVAWENTADVDLNQSDGSLSHIRADLFVGAGETSLSDDFVVNSSTNGRQGQASLTTLADGRLIATWTDFGGNSGTPGSDVRGQMLDPRTEAVHLTGTALNDDWIGTRFNDIMNGGVGNDTLKGAGGQDLLDGGPGADDMHGGAGDDIYIVDDAGDFVDEFFEAGGTDTVVSFVSFALGFGVERLSLIGLSAINGTGNELANLIGGNAAANVLDGGAGADTMDGGSGDDTYIVDDVGDRLFEAAAGGTDLVRSSVSFALGDFFENLTLTGPAAIGGTGNVLANVIIGNSADNLIVAGGGDDSVDGDAGDDRIEGGLGDDTLRGGDGNDAIDGGDGNDAIDGGPGADVMAGGLGDDVYVVDQVGDAVAEVSGAGNDTVVSAIAFTLGANLENLILTGSASAAAKASPNGANGIGNELANTIVGSAGGNRLNGAAGNDALKGEGGLDLLKGSSGRDLLDGGPGRDLLIGGKGKDQFLFDSKLKGNVDKIADFSHPKDTILLDDAIFTKLKPGALSADAFFTGSAAHDANDRIVYDQDRGALFYDKNGDKAGGSVKFATVTPGLDLDHTDFLVI